MAHITRVDRTRKSEPFLKNGKQQYRYVVRYRLADGSERKRSFNTLQAAREFVTEVEGQKITGALVDPQKGRTTYAKWWDEYQVLTKGELRPSSVARDESYYRSLIAPTFADVQLRDIDELLCGQWSASLKESGKAPATINKAQQILNKTLKRAVEKKRIASNPAACLKNLTIPDEEARFLSPIEVEKLAGAIEPRYRSLVLLGAYCGLRIGELAALKWENVDLLKRRVTVEATVVDLHGHATVGPPKTKASKRSVPIPRAVAKELEALMESAHSEFVFTGPEGSMLRPNNFRRRSWSSAVTKAGLEGLTPHGMRHTAVALWIASGATPKEIAARAGHRSVVTVLDRYGHLFDHSEDAVTDALDAAISKAKEPTTETTRALNAPYLFSEATSGL